MSFNPPVPVSPFNQSGGFYPGGAGVGYSSPDTLSGNIIGKYVDYVYPGSYVLFAISSVATTGTLNTCQSVSYGGIAFTQILGPLDVNGVYASAPNPPWNNGAVTSPRHANLELWGAYFPTGAVPGLATITMTNAPTNGQGGGTTVCVSPLNGVNGATPIDQTSFVVDTTGGGSTSADTTGNNELIMTIRVSLYNVANETLGPTPAEGGSLTWANIVTYGGFPGAPADYSVSGVAVYYATTGDAPTTQVVSASTPNAEIIATLSFNGGPNPFGVYPLIDTAVSLPCVPCCTTCLNVPI